MTAERNDSPYAKATDDKTMTYYQNLKKIK